ncbi:MAG: rRNA pseudouridine synthase [Phycisphaeraceae bacterium]|nr:MAG: rRNA pseudouridine synthase [Phycisphaeraceae bacterium]
MAKRGADKESRDQATDPRNPGLRDAASGIRLQKAMADAGVGSRRRCEELIESGKVSVNGRIVRTLPAWVDPERDEIAVGGEPVGKVERHVYVMLYKPRHTVSTLHDPDERRTVAELVQHPSGARLYPVGRLDYDTMGLVLLTNDGEMANRLTHPRYEVHKTYRAIVKGSIEDEEIRQLERGIYLAVRREGKTVGGERTGGAHLRVVRRERERTILDITLTEGRNRQVRRMLAHVGHRVRKLTRIHMGPLTLKGLRLGEWRELTSREIQELRKATGLQRRGKQGKGGSAGAVGRKSSGA